jgi:probable HAF family extracellular repeat protein
MRRLLTLVALAIFCFLGHGTASAEIRYTLTDLGTLGTFQCIATAVNYNGQVAGYATFSGGIQHAFLYSNGATTDLGALYGATKMRAAGINSTGEVVGSGYTTTNGYFAFACINGTLSDLGTFPAAHYSSAYAYAVNYSGQVAGMGYTSGGASHGFICSNGTFTDVGVLPNYPSGSQASAINNSGQVAGYAENLAGDYRAFLYDSGKMTDLGTLGGASSVANGINNLGQVVGVAATATGSAHAFLYAAGKMTDLGLLSGCSSTTAQAVNDKAVVVGFAYAAGFGDYAFVDDKGTMSKLDDLIDPSLQWHLFAANAINNRGCIVGSGVAPDNTQHAYLLTPIPEPSALILFVAGALSLLGRAWRRQRRTA